MKHPDTPAPNGSGGAGGVSSGNTVEAKKMTVVKSISISAATGFLTIGVALLTAGGMHSNAVGRIDKLEEGQAKHEKIGAHAGAARDIEAAKVDRAEIKGVLKEIKTKQEASETSSKERHEFQKEQLAEIIRQLDKLQK